MIDPSKHRFDKRFARGNVRFNLPRLSIGQIDFSWVKTLLYFVLIFCLLCLTAFSGWVAINIVEIEKQKMTTVDKKIENEITPIRHKLDLLDALVQDLDAHKQPIVIYEIKQKIPVRVKR